VDSKEINLQPFNRVIWNSRQRGSLLILVVVSLILMVIMGSAFLQIARVDRLATKELSDNYINEVQASVINLISNILKQDGLEMTKDGGGESYDYPWTRSLPASDEDWVEKVRMENLASRDNDGLGNEFPSLSDILSAGYCDSVNEDSPDSGPFTCKVAGGHHDDRWLAATAPEFGDQTGQEDPVWKHITNLNGVFLRLPAVNPDPEAIGEPVEFEIDNRDDRNVEIRHLYRDSGLKIIDTSGEMRALDDQDEDSNPIWEDIGVDSSGDGVYDSRWSYPPLRTIRGITYVMAVRVQDLSSLINVNVATAYTEDGTSPTDEHWGLTPSSIDLSRLFSRFNNGDPDGDWDWEDELAGDDEEGSIFSFRGIDLELPTPFGHDYVWDRTLNSKRFPDYAPGSRFGSWYDNARRYGFSENESYVSSSAEYQRYGIIDEIALRKEVTSGTNTKIETSAPELMRKNSNAVAYHQVEGIKNAVDVTDTTTNGLRSTVKAMAKYFQGCNEDFDCGSQADSNISSRKFYATRHMLTTRSGAALWSPNYGDMHNYFINDSGISTSNLKRKLKYDLVWSDLDGDGNYPQRNVQGYPVRVKKVAQRLESVFLTTGEENEGYLGFAFDPTDPLHPYKSSGREPIKQISTEFAMAIQDYSDADRVPTVMWLDMDGDGGRLESGAEAFTYYGLEPLPFVREIYVQIAYEGKDRLSADPDAPGMFIEPGDGLLDTWEFHPDSQAMVIEIGNPFSEDIEINLNPNYMGRDHNRVDLQIKLVLEDGEDKYIPINSVNFVEHNGASLGSTITIRAGGRIIFYSNPEDMSYGGEDGFGVDLGVDLFDALKLDKEDEDGEKPEHILRVKRIPEFSPGEEVGESFSFPVSPVNGSQDEEVTVELQVWTPGINNKFESSASAFDFDDHYATYDRFSLEGVNFLGGETTLKEDLLPEEQPGSVDPIFAHSQGSVARDCKTSISYMSDEGRDLIRDENQESLVRQPDLNGYRYSSNKPVDKLNKNLKGHHDSGNRLDRFAVDSVDGTDKLMFWPNRPISHISTLTKLLMFGFVAGEDEGTGSALSTRVADDENENRLYLDATSFDDGVPDITVPSLAPELKQGIPRSLMVLDEFTTLSVRRDGIDNDNEGSDNGDSSGEVLLPGTINVNTSPLHILTLSAPLPDQTEDLDNIQALMESVVKYRNGYEERNEVLEDSHPLQEGARFNNLRNDPGISSLSELLIIDPEDAGGLMQSYNTRSDFYVAYVLLRGYQNGKFNEGAVVAKRFFAIFDRSSVIDADDKVKVLGVWESY